MNTQHFLNNPNFVQLKPEKPKSKVKQYYPFPLPFYLISIPDWPRKKVALENLVDWNDPKCMYNDHFSDYHKNLANEDPYGKPTYLADFIDIIKPELMELAKILRCDITIKSLWAQRYWKHNHMRPHTHGITDFSAVLYHDFHKGHEATEFWAPYKNPLTGDDYTHIPIVKEGDLIVFPSTLVHYAVPNESDYQRTIFSFNFKGTNIERVER